MWQEIGFLIGGFSIGYSACRLHTAWNKKYIRIYKKLNLFYRTLPDLLQDALMHDGKDSLPYNNLAYWWGDTFQASGVAVYFYTDFSEEVLNLKGAWFSESKQALFPLSLRTEDVAKGDVQTILAPYRWIPFPVQDKNTKLGFILHLYDSGNPSQSSWNLFMKEAAGVVSKGIVLIQNLAEVTKAQNERSRSEYLQELQNSLSRIKGQDQAELCIQHWLRPKLGINSDYLDLLVRDTTEYFLFHGEVTSKGIDAILTMVILKTVIHTSRLLVKDPAIILNRINRVLCSFFQGDYFASLTALYINLSERRLLYAKAGTSGAKRFSLNRDIKQEIESDIPLGIEKNHTYTSKPVSFESGDLWVFFSDGLVESVNEKREPFGTHRLENLLQEHKFTTCRAILSKIKESFSSFMKEQDPQDDVSVVVLKFR